MPDVEPEMLLAVMAAVQAKAPVELVRVQPVEAEPPPKTKLPVEVLPMLMTPAPLASRERAISVSSPVEASVSPLPVAALVIVNWFTAEATESKVNISLPFESAMNPPSANLGAVSVLFVSVSVVVLPTYVSVPWKVMVVESVPAKVRVLLIVAVLPDARVKVPVVEVIFKPS